MHQPREVWRLTADAPHAIDQDFVVEEAPLKLSARGQVVATIMRTPGHDLELVRGFLHAEGKAAAVQVVDDNLVDIDLPAAEFAPRAVASVAGCGVCGRNDIDDLVAHAELVTSTLVVARTILLNLPARLREAQPAFDATGGLHAAGLFASDGTLLFAREDVGRHNAVDKVIGAGLAAQVDFGACLLMLSGRLGFELALKAVMAAIPIVASVSAPSTLALDLATRFGVTTVGFVRDGRANIYGHAQRIS